MTLRSLALSGGLAGTLAAAASVGAAFIVLPVDAVPRTARADFPRLPEVRAVPDISDECGGGVVTGAVYCTTQRVIYLDESTKWSQAGPYLVAHLLGHGLQVEYGIADFALAAIRAEPAREAELRGMVERQNDCFAGMFLARAGLPMPNLFALFEADPFGGAHWGRNPVRDGPVRPMALADRAEWLAIGYAAAMPGACDVGEVSADLIVAADAAD